MTNKETRGEKRVGGFLLRLNSGTAATAAAAAIGGCSGGVMERAARERKSVHAGPLQSFAPGNQIGLGHQKYLTSNLPVDIEPNNIFARYMHLQNTSVRLGSEVTSRKVLQQHGSVAPSTGAE